MKKILSLFALALATQTALADDVIASYTFPDQSSITATATVNGTNCTVSYAKIGGSASNEKSLNGKYYHKFTNATSAWVKITLTSGSFQGGDKFYATLYSGSASTDGFKFKSTSGNSCTITYATDAENTLEYTLTDDDINEDGSLTIYRYSSNCYVRHLEVTRATGATKQNPTTSFANGLVGFKNGEAAGQTLTTNSDGAVTYESSNTAVVTVDANGALTAINPGKATITGKTASSNTYTASSASYVVYVLSNATGTLESPYLPTDFRYLSETYVPQYTEVESEQVETSVKAWAVGYIVGVYNSGEQDVKIITGTTTTEGTIGLGNTADETVGKNCLAVQLISETQVRTDLNLKANGSNLKKKVWVYGRIGSFTTSSQTVYGLRHADAYSWDGSTVVPEGVVTAINRVATDKQQNGEVYNLAGQRVAQPAKGLYIVNGNKVVIK